MISLEQAAQQIAAAIPPARSEEIPLARAHGRITAAGVPAAVDLPSFDNSAIDGDAVRGEDLQSASAANPVTLNCIGRIAAGESYTGAMQRGACVRIFTGSPMPAGADAVVMQEDVVVEGSSIRFAEPVRPFENVRLRGEDIRRGSIIVGKGVTLNPVCLGLLAAAGVHQVSMAIPPRVALLATGTELRERGEALGPSGIYESNRTLLAGLLAEIACPATILPLVRDDLAGTVEAFRTAFETHDAVISTGGVSVGEFDFVKEAFEKLGGKIELWKLSVRPGKPFVFGRLGSRILFGLPGNPVSALVTFLVLVRPALLAWQGAASTALPRVPGFLAERVINRGDRRHFMRVRWDSGEVRIAGPQGSHRLGSLADANGLIDVPPAAELPAGTKVEVQLWGLP